MPRERDIDFRIRAETRGFLTIFVRQGFTARSCLDDGRGRFAPSAGHVAFGPDNIALRQDEALSRIELLFLGLCLPLLRLRGCG